MRIWSFPSFYPIDLPNRRWNGIFAHRQNLALRDLGVEVKVVQPVQYKYPFPLDKIFPCPTDIHSRAFPRQRVLDGIQVFHPIVSDPRPNRLFRRSFSENYVQAILDFFQQKKIILNGKEDFFYAQWLPDAGLVQIAARKLGVKCGILVIGDDVTILPKQNQRYREFFVQTLINADFRFSVSDELARESNRIIGQNLDFKIIRRGVNHQYFFPLAVEEKIKLRKKWGLSEQETVLLCVGSAIENKGWNELLDAVRDLIPVFPALKLMAVYAGRSEINILEGGKTRGIERHLYNLGEVEPAKMPEIFQLADVFCLPSYSEGLSNAVAEAMATGLPVVTTHVGGHPEIIQSGQTGILIEPRSTTALREALRLLLENPKYASGLGINARTFICEIWGDYKINSKKIINCIK
jgi:teichuronic acid biosynthesis glycosyltransferase TuaC